MEITVRMTPGFYSEWLMSEVVDNFASEDIPLMRTILAEDDTTAAAMWEHHFRGIHDFDRERVHFNICMLNAKLLKSKAEVTFDDDAIIYVLHPLSLDYQMDKWADWGKEGAGFIRSARRIKREMMEQVKDTPVGDRIFAAIREMAERNREWSKQLLSR